MPHRSMLLAVLALAALPAPAHARTFDLSGGDLTAAAANARPGDTLELAPGTYRGTFRPAVSGTAAAPIRLVASAPGVVLDGGGAANAVKLIGVHDWRLEGVTITGGANQGAWLESTDGIVLENVTVTGNPGAGVQLKNAVATTIDHAVLSANGSAGVMELAGSRGTRVTASRIQGNGIGGAAYNGDGIQLGGTGAVVSGNTIAGNGTGQFEHGIYAGAASSGWTIADNDISGSGGANIKASGVGVVRDNQLSGGMYGIVLASNPSPVSVTANTLSGRAQHLVFVTTGAKAQLDGDTVHQAGRSTSSGDASAIFVNEADSVSVSHTTACYDGTDDLGIGFWINAASRIGSLALSANTYCSHDKLGRAVAYNGSRVSAAQWRTLTGDISSTFG